VSPFGLQALLDAQPPAPDTAFPETESGHVSDTPLQAFDPIFALEVFYMTPTLCLQYVPRRARRFVADSYNRLLKGINAVPNCIHSHAKLLLFVLAVKIEKKVKQCRQVKDRALQYSKLE
jgi:hypothetical protein